MHGLLYSNVPIFPLYILITRMINYTSYIQEGSTHFGVEVSQNFGLENDKRKISNILKKFFN